MDFDDPLAAVATGTRMRVVGFVAPSCCRSSTTCTVTVSPATRRVPGGQRIELHAHRDALREPHPVERRVDAGQQVGAGGAVAVGDAGGDALDGDRPRRAPPIGVTRTRSPTWMRGSLVSSK